MRVLLINSNLKDDLLAAPPIGLCYVASAAEVAGHEVRVLDLCFKRRLRQELEKAIIGFSPQVIGVSLRNLDNANMLRPVSYLPSALKIIQVIRELTAVPLVLGGSGASLDPQGVLEFLQGDYLIVSEGEKSFVELLDALNRGESPAEIPGVAMWRQGEFRVTPPQLTSFPSGNPRLAKWVDLAPYEKMGGGYTVQTKRGCRMRCIYCTYNQVLEGNHLRLRSPMEVVDEIEEALYRFHPEGFEFVDSVFNDPVGHCQEILEEIIRRPWKARFSTMGVSPKNLDVQFLQLMQRAGFTSFMTSPESASETMLTNYQKGFGIEDLRRAAEAINQFAFPVLWYFLVGGPGETRRTVQETLDFIEQYLVRKEGPSFNQANIFLGVRIYPGTKLWQIALDDGLIHDHSKPLEPLWYLSRELDLEVTMRQLYEAACRRPEIALGDMEKYLPLTKLFGVIRKVFPFPKPYWQHLLPVHQMLVKLGVRSLFQATGVPARLREYLKLQSNRSISAPVADKENRSAKYCLKSPS
ncbi:MAG: radical SAM protein [Deltaproteobacteria bacterium]|nr:radical SAM protein [Deltaproteobacteria bacterium]